MRFERTCSGNGQRAGQIGRSTGWSNGVVNGLVKMGGKDLALGSYALVEADLRPLALLALGPDPVVLADLRPLANLAPTLELVVDANLRAFTLLAGAPDPIVRADLRPLALLAPERGTWGYQAECSPTHVYAERRKDQWEE